MTSAPTRRAVTQGSHVGIVVLRLTDQSAPAVDDAVTEPADSAGLELVSTHGETGLTARLVPFTAYGLIPAASMLVLEASRRRQPVPPLARWCLGAGIVATIGANLAHGIGDGPIGALVSAWPALALVVSFELLMMLIRAERGTVREPWAIGAQCSSAPVLG